MTRFAKKLVVLSKHICIALNTKPPECIVDPEAIGGLGLTVDANTVHYREVENRQMETEPHVEVKHETRSRRCMIGDMRSRLILRLKRISTNSL